MSKMISIRSITSMALVFAMMFASMAVFSDNVSAQGRAIRVVNATGSAGNNVVVPFALTSQGDEVAASFTINFDPTVLTYVSAALGNGVPAGTALTQNTLQTGNGRLGILFDSGNPFMASPPDRVALNVTFAVNVAAAPNSTTPVSFGSTPTPQSVSDSLGNLLDTTYVPGMVTILGPSSAQVTVSGRVTSPQGLGLRGATVSMTDAEGNTISVTTGSFGHFLFDSVESGESYVVRVSSKRFRFTPRVVNIGDSLTGLDFIGQE